MKKELITIFAVLALFASCTNDRGPLDYVNTELGGVGVLLQPTRPTVHLPNQVIRWSPMRSDLLDDQISCYPLTLASHRLQSVFGFLPLPADCPESELFTRKQVYDHEKTTPYLYSSDLEGCSIRFTASKKSGIIEVVFDEESEENMFRFTTLVPPGSFEQVDDHCISGISSLPNMKAYLWFETDCPISSVRKSNNGKHMIACLASKKVTARYGISYISIDQARENLGKEIDVFNLDKVASESRKVWEETLGKIKVSGGSDFHKRMFYSALYRCSERAVDINEYGRYYSSFDSQVHEDAEPFFTDNWMWDTHIALEPLQTILNPEKEEQKVHSYLKMYQQCGSMPSFAVIWGDWPAMTGNYAAVWMADSWAKGLRFDLDVALKGLKENSLESTLLPWKNGPKCVLDDFYNEHGYYPSLHPGEEETVPEVSLPWERRQAVSLTTAFSYADWAVAQLAKVKGNEEDVELFNKRAAFYKNAYRPEKKMFWPMDMEGNWIEGVDPRYMDRAYYTENNAYTFQWDVKHDLYGLFELMGGAEAAEKNLDDLFRIQNDIPKYKFYLTLPDATGMMGQFAMGNEPSFHIPYIYNYLGTPWKTQKRIHHVVDYLFSDGVLGLPGDEDGGGMSAFLVFSMMGFFPVTPGIPVYAIGSPFFEKASIELQNGRKFTVRAKNFSEDNKYIQSAKLNGKALEKSWFTHDEMMEGGCLELVMGPKPNKEWGSDKTTLPPSSIDWNPVNSK